MEKIFTRPKSLKKAVFHYCPGCGHSIAHRITCEVIDELGIQDRTVGVPPPGCSVFAYYYFDVDMVECAHGRGAAVATGLKRASPESIVFTYQGDGDLAGIGTAETIHAANRGENITAIFINNAVYGMTGGQMAPTTMLGMKTTTSPFGRDSKYEGHPIRMSEILSQIKGTCYIERVAVNTPAHIRKAKQAIKKAFQCQLDGLGYSLVEILSPCPTNWKMTPVEAGKWIDNVMSKEYPLGVLKDTTGKSDVG
jgi:2-oxoglutarate/2-oxoacid ferredoxin oxidoreductase subunit beta